MSHWKKNLSFLLVFAVLNIAFQVELGGFQAFHSDHENIMSDHCKTTDTIGVEFVHSHAQRNNSFRKGVKLLKAVLVGFNSISEAVVEKPTVVHELTTHFELSFDNLVFSHRGPPLA